MSEAKGGRGSPPGRKRARDPVAPVGLGPPPRRGETPRDIGEITAEIEAQAPAKGAPATAPMAEASGAWGRKDPCVICAESGRKAFCEDLDVAFQPIVDLAQGSVFAQEALIRGADGSGAAKVFAAVTHANRYSFDQKCRMRAIRTAAEIGMTDDLCVNIMPNAIHDPVRCIQATLRAAERFDFPRERIIFEITETEPLRDPVHMNRVVEIYRDMGFRIAIDDFGAGFAGLTLLTEIRPDLVKIDMALTRQVDRDPVRQAVAQAVIDLAARLDLGLIAEGVETEAERDWLHERGVVLQQGRLFSPPRFREAVSAETLLRAGALTR